MSSPRYNKPESGNKYFIRKANGGYSSCITGNPTDPVSNVLANCVGYANGFFNELEGKNREIVPLNCNAENFIERAIAYGYSVVKDPVIGGIMVWQYGATLSGKDGAGHVAGVYEIVNKDCVRTSESAYGGTAFFRATRYRGANNWSIGRGYTYRGCIVPKYWKPSPTPTPTPTPGPSGKFNIGDQVIINGPLYKNSNATNPSGSTGDKKTVITRKAVGSAHPYNTTGDLGWMDESSIKPYVAPTPTPTPTPQPTGLQVGDQIRIKSSGNSDSYGTGKKAFGIGWTRYITKIYEGRAYPYQVGNKGKTDGANTTGFYKAEALEKL